ncbi:unnamed protein product [Rotaria socialis]|uniref:Uncharacterized protein n=1 Tax=Rotaria socialis TaxID=392032 RepID=A0A817T4A9_9BILA|nr:unnamed protein product [Rotaria socialis]CAF4638842.1 unnamed protein product [Rotaria socialis]
MISKECQRHHHAFLKETKFQASLKLSTSGTLSPATIATTSSGYSTGDSSTSAIMTRNTRKSSSSITCNQHKTKSKGFQNIISKLKSFFISPKPKPKSKLKHSTTPKGMQSTSTFDHYSAYYGLPSSSSSSTTTNNTIAIPFTYYHNSPIKSKYYYKPNAEPYTARVTNFEKISAWLNYTDSMTQKEDEEDSDEFIFIDEFQEQSISPSLLNVDYQIIMKKNLSSIRMPRRSTSLVATLNRPVIEQKQYERSVSPAASFTSSILTKGMSERMTPQKTHYYSRTNLTEEPTQNLVIQSNRRRLIDFSRRRTVGGPNEHNTTNTVTSTYSNNKENVPINRRPQQIYRFSPSTSTIIATKKYFFHSKPSQIKNEDMLMNSYGLTLMQQQQQQQQQQKPQLQQRHSISSVVMTPKMPDNSSIYLSQKQQNRRSSIHLLQQQYTSDSLDDLLCDREVESYFYPNRRQSPTFIPRHTYINLESPSSHYSPPPPYIHGTLC